MNHAREGWHHVVEGLGEPTSEFEVTTLHANPMSALHSGVLCNIAEAAMGAAYRSILTSGETFTTLAGPNTPKRPARSLGRPAALPPGVQSPSRGSLRQGPFLANRSAHLKPFLHSASVLAEQPREPAHERTRAPLKGLRATFALPSGVRGPTDDPTALAAALSQALAELSRDIAVAVQELEAHS